MGRGSTEIEPFDRGAVVGEAWHGPAGEELIERHGSLENISAGQIEGPFEVERRQDLAGDDGARTGASSRDKRAISLGSARLVRRLQLAGSHRWICFPRRTMATTLSEAVQQDFFTLRLGHRSVKRGKGEAGGWLAEVVEAVKGET